MKNRVNVYGVILPSAWDCEREFFSEFAATFPVQVAEALAAADKSKDLELYIDSPGGYIDAGRSMISMIEDWCAQNNRQCHVTVGGMAASMAAVMMVAFKGRVTVHECSSVMFHAAKTAIWDDATAEELRDTASALEAFNTYAAKMIARRTGLSESEAAALIAGRKESFFGATDLIDAKLADEIQGEVLAIRQPSARAIRACSKQFSANAHDVGGLLAAVAVSAAVGQTQGGPIMAKKNKSKASADAPAPEAVVVEQAEAEKTAEAVNDTAQVDDAAPVDDPPAEEAKAAETAEDPAPAEEEQEAAPEETPVESEESEEESEETAAEPQESEDVKALRAELAQAKAALNAAEARAKAAETALKEAKMTVVTAALTPAPERPALQEPPAVAWRKAVRACGDNIAVAKAKHPELYAALTK